MDTVYLRMGVVAGEPKVAVSPEPDKRSRDDLMRLEPADIRTSPVFSLLGIDE